MSKKEGHVIVSKLKIMVSAHTCCLFRRWGDDIPRQLKLYFSKYLLEELRCCH